MRDTGKVVLWPMYFDSDVSWRDGRRLSKNTALKGVGAEEIFQAALDLGLDPELRASAAHPRRPWERHGAINVKKVGPKADIIRDLAKRIRQKRAPK